MFEPECHECHEPEKIILCLFVKYFFVKA